MDSPRSLLTQAEYVPKVAKFNLCILLLGSCCCGIGVVFAVLDILPAMEIAAVGGRLAKSLPEREPGEAREEVVEVVEGVFLKSSFKRWSDFWL